MAEPPSRATARSTSRLGIKMALAASGGALAVLVAAWALSLTDSLWALAGCSVLIGVGVYVLADRLLTHRIELARRTLKDVRMHQFESLEKLHVPRGDELNALIWQVYRTGLALEKEIGELKKMEHYRRDYIGNVSHELKTPIFAIQGFAETLLDGAMDDPRVSRLFVEKILRNTSRLQHLSRDLSELSRIETGELKMTMAPFSIARVVSDVAESLEARATSRDIHLRQRIPEALPAVVGDRERIRQVITNLVENAIKYNTPGGFVDVAAELRPEGTVAVTITDNGIGVAPQHLGRLTERFFRADKSRAREQGGTGLGLAIVKHILAAHHSKLFVESKLGQGSSFGFSLAVAPHDA